MVMCINVTPLAFQVSIINEDWVSPNITSMMKKMSYEPRTGLGKKKKNGISKLSNFKGHTNNQGLGYDLAIDKGKKTIFISKGLSKYQVQPEEWECNRIKKLGFEIFSDVINIWKREKN